MAFFPRVGAPGVGFNLLNQTSNLVTLQASEIFLIPSGEYLLAPGPYTSLQFLDPVSGRWITSDAETSLQPIPIDSDGTNVRLANLTGCPVGANITAAGNGVSLTNGIGAAVTGLTVTASAGGSTWIPVVGGAVNPTVTITAGGSGYLYPPNIQFSVPPSGGVQASGYTLLTGSTVTSVVVVNQGAGYTTAPTIAVSNDARDTVGVGAILTCNSTLIGNTQVTALYPSNPGTALTAVPTLSFSPTSAITATPVMNFTVTGLSGVGSQTGFGSAAASVLCLGIGGNVTPNATRITAGIAGPIMDVNLTQERPAILLITGNSNALTTTASIIDGGVGFQTIPTPFIIPAGGSTNTTAGIATFTVGGTTDTSYLQPV